MLRWAEICDQVNFFQTNTIDKNIIRLQITMNYSFRMNKIEWNADHCYNSKNWIFRELIANSDFSLEQKLKAIIALFHYYVWKIMLIFDYVNDTAYQRVL